MTLRLTGTPALLSLRPGAITAVEQPRSARVEKAAPAMDPAAARVVVTETSQRSGAKLDLGEAPVIVSGGRGLRAPENFKLVEELAAAFGNAAVGATRAVTDDGWRPSTDQIGQTGRRGEPRSLRGAGHLRGHPAPRRHAHRQDHRRDQQGQGRADLQDRGLRDRGGSVRGRAPSHRGDPEGPELGAASARAPAPGSAARPPSTVASSGPNENRT